MTTPAGHFTLGPGNGHVFVRTRRAGLAAKVGHDLTLEFTAWRAEVDLPAGEPAGATVRTSLDLVSLVVREGVGGAKPLTDGDRREIEKTARGLLAPDRFPTATFASTRVVPGVGGGSIEGTLELHGRSAPLTLAVTEAAPGRYRATGTLSQSAYGIKPYSAFLGALKLRDEVEIEADVDVSGANAAPAS